MTIDTDHRVGSPTSLSSTREVSAITGIVPDPPRDSEDGGAVQADDHPAGDAASPDRLAPGLARIRDVLTALELPRPSHEGRTRDEVAAEEQQTLNRFLGLDTATFVSAGDLAAQLLAAIDEARCTPRQRELAARDVGDAERADHVRYHGDAAGVLLDRLRRHYAAGTHWFGRYNDKVPSWEMLVTGTLFDLKNFHSGLRGRDDLIRHANDPLTCDWEQNVSIGPWVFRQQRDHGILSPRLCGWRRTPSDRDDTQAQPRNFVWFLSDPPPQRGNTFPADVAPTA